MQEEKLLTLKKKVDQLKIDQGVKKEKREVLLKDLKQYGLSSADEAHEKAGVLADKSEELEEKKAKLIKKVETKLEDYE